MVDVFNGWADRLSWSDETPLNYPGLNPVAALRFDGMLPDGKSWPDAVNPANTWTSSVASGAGVAVQAGPRGPLLAMNLANPGTEQGRVTLPYFPGLWPASGKLLVGLWVNQGYTMSFNPLLSTRGGSSPLVYLSTYTGGSVRQGVYDGSGALALDTFETTAWAAVPGEWQWIGQLVDLDAKTSRIAVVRAKTREKFVGAVKALSAAPNAASTADLDVFSLQTAGYWTGGYADEVMVAQPGAGFDFPAYVERVRLGLWADGASAASAPVLNVDDTAVTADAAATLSTGAEKVSWTTAPDPVNHAAVPYWSTDGGASWLSGVLPGSLDGLLRWQVPLGAGDAFTGLTLLPPAPTLAQVDDRSVEQNTTVTVPLTASWAGDAVWSVAAAGVVASVSGTTLSVETGWAAGPTPVSVTLRDGYGRTATVAFTLTVVPVPWTPAPTRQYSHAPLILWDDDGPEVAVPDPVDAVVGREVNGKQTLEFTLPVNHPKAGLLRSERVVELSGEEYRVRRVTTSRSGKTPVFAVYCEARFYDLAYAGEVPAKDYLLTPPGPVIADALAGTGWSVGAVTVATRRTYSVEATTPLALLRTVAQQHGGDLLFDNAARTVSLVVASGRDVGVSFFYGHGLTESKRIADTTSLVTRIYARNEDGVTVAAANGGVPYLEDFTWTKEVREATYNFAAGTSPFTMLEMTRAVLASRCKPAMSYEFTVADLSFRTGQAVDRFDVGDTVTVVDDDLGVREAQRIVAVEHDVVRPWASKITLSGKLREAGETDSTVGAELSTGSPFSTFDLVPYNLLKNGRFDNGLAHWAASGAAVVPGDGTGPNAVRFQGSGERWVEQTVSPDNRDVYALSLDVSSLAGGEVPPLTAVVTVVYEDGSTDTIPVDLA